MLCKVKWELSTAHCFTVFVSIVADGNSKEHVYTCPLPCLDHQNYSNNIEKWNERIGVLGHNSTLEGYTGPGTTWVNEMNSVRNHASGARSIARPDDQQSSMPLNNLDLISTPTQNTSNYTITSLHKTLGQHNVFNISKMYNYWGEAAKTFH